VLARRLGPLDPAAPRADALERVAGGRPLALGARTGEECLELAELVGEVAFGGPRLGVRGSRAAEDVGSRARRRAAPVGAAVRWRSPARLDWGGPTGVASIGPPGSTVRDTLQASRIS
jgi:hypothetical protein